MLILGKKYIIIIIFCMTGMLTGCALSEEEETALDEFADATKEYYEDTYYFGGTVEYMR